MRTQVIIKTKNSSELDFGMRIQGVVLRLMMLFLECENE